MRWWIAGGVACLALVGVFFRHEIGEGVMTGFRWVSDRDKVEHFISAFGNGAPLVFMAIQILQVLGQPDLGHLHADLRQDIFVFDECALERQYANFHVLIKTQPHLVCRLKPQ
jgi:hypothetical protein